MPGNIPSKKKELIITVHNPNNLPIIDFHELKELQGDLKITTPAKIEKLKKSIIKYGIFVPKFVWIDNNTYYIEDGHQTVKVLTELEKGGYTVPPIPYVEIQAEDRKDAGEKLLMINSRFADINPETSFFKDFDIGLEFAEEIEIPELELQIDKFDIINDEKLDKNAVGGHIYNSPNSFPFRIGDFLAFLQRERDNDAVELEQELTKAIDGALSEKNTLIAKKIIGVLNKHKHEILSK